MRVVHMDSGLGNQMLDYAEFLAIQESNPDDICYLETIIYDLPHVPGMFSQWNGCLLYTSHFQRLGGKA